MRFNYGQTLRRPNFIDLNPNFNLTTDLTSVGYGSGTGGNPDLEATEATNYDFTVEWYFENDSAIYGTVFPREIEGLVVPLTRRITILGTRRPASSSPRLLNGGRRSGQADVRRCFESHEMLNTSDMPSTRGAPRAR